MLSSLAGAPAAAQPRGAAQPQPAIPARQAPALPTPDPLVTAKLLWSTMAAIDHASKTGNFSVLRDLGTAGFRANNKPETLSAVFANVRNQRVDVADTLLVQAVFELPPHMISPTTFRMRGSFPLRPTSVAFDLLFSWEGSWRIDAIALLPISAPAGR